MRTVIALAIGFWVARHIYLNYEQQALRKEDEVKRRLKNYLEGSGFSAAEAGTEADKIIGTS